MLAYMILDRLDEAKIVYEEGRKRKLDGGFLRENRYLVAFLEGDTAGMHEQLEWAQGKSNFEAQFMELQSDTEAYCGRYTAARTLTEKAQVLAESGHANKRVAAVDAAVAWREAAVGNFALARQQAARALAESNDRDVKSPAAMALALSGDAAAAKAFADELGRKYPSDTFVQNYVVPTIRALLEINRGHGDKAVELLQPSLALELASSDYIAMQSTYVRGLAYLQLGKSREASAEFQKIIDHPGLVANCVIGTLAHLQVARSEVMSGDPAAARIHYQDFLALWKGADPEVPILKQAEAEYARLK